MSRLNYFLLRFNFRLVDDDILKNGAFFSLLGTRLQCSLCCRLEYVTHTLFRLCWTFQICHGIYCARYFAALFVAHRFFFHFSKLTPRIIVIAQVFLVADKNDGHAWTKVTHFGLPLFCNVLQAVRIIDAETHDDHVRVGIGEWS